MLNSKVLILLGLATVAGLLAWQITIQADPLVPMPPELLQTGVAEQTPELLAVKLRHTLQNDSAGLAVFAGLLVAVAGLFFSASKAIVVRIGIVVLGLVLGAATGVGMGYTGDWLRQVLPVDWTPSTTASTIWAIVLSELAVACSVVASLGLGCNRHTAKMWAGGIVGAILAAVLFPLVTGALFPYENSDPTLPIGYWSRGTLFLLPSFIILALMEFQHARSSSETMADNSKKSVEVGEQVVENASV